MKLVLFDVDGTLLSSSGAGRRALERALREVYGSAGPIDSYDFQGGTDLQIVRDLMAAARVPAEVVTEGESQLFARYAEYLDAEVGDGGGVSVYPGVKMLVERLAATDECVVGLLTGNIEAGARIKLRPTGLWPRFRLGAYGSDHADRNRLPAVAARRAEALVGRAFRGSDLVVIGDTPRDIECARAFGASAIAVATGRLGVADLLAHSPDHAFPDLADTDRVLTAIRDGRAER
jgi:phosphoglycolate phosphatase